MNAPEPVAPIVAPPLDHAQIRLIIVGVLMAMFLAALDQTIVATALPTIGRDLGGFELLPWIVTSYLITSTAITPLYGKVSDIVGRRPTLLVGILTFVAGSVACALAPNILSLIAARALQGLGGGGLISLAQTIIADIVAPKERGRYQVYIAGMYTSASLLGPVLGGLFSEHLHWSAIFWINVPLGAVAFAMTNSLLRKLPRHERPHALDVPGALLIMAATSVLMLALSWGGVRYPWGSVPILGLIAAAAVLWVLFGLRLGHADEPLIPLSLFANSVVRHATGAACCAMGVFVGLTIYVPVYLELVAGLSAGSSGLALLPLMVGTVVGATVSGQAMKRIEHYKRSPLIGLSIAIAATMGLALFASRLPVAGLMALFGCLSAGLGTVLPVTTVAVQNAVSIHQMGIATGGVNFFRSLGGAMVVAAFGAILLGGGVAAGFHGIGGGNVAGSLDQVLAAFRHLFLAAAALLAVALAFIARMEERPLRSGKAGA
ncbi:MFS transporter [Alsobacter sp. SYSU M60028]|uniref:MFS transporter n=1 Tax=Alsobacter ponti TaxID=2962936 RepID=A0ABT1LG20_9HYPH|nr:MDR family MFS transporter [Alsobacter ponti]MCP8939906.1 MFS transporter [Alsobacter ponti]